MSAQSAQVPDVLAAVRPREYVIDIKERVCSEMTGRIDDTQRAVNTTSADPLLTCCNLHALSRRHLDARWETLLPKERVGLLEFELQLSDDCIQLVDRVT